MKRSVMIRLDESDYQLWLTTKAHPANRMYPNALVFINALRAWLTSNAVVDKQARMRELMSKGLMTPEETHEYQRLRTGL